MYMTVKQAVEKWGIFFSPRIALANAIPCALHLSLREAD